MTKNQVVGLAIVLGCAAWFINEYKKDQCRMLYGVDSLADRNCAPMMEPNKQTQDQ